MSLNASGAVGPWRSMLKSKIHRATVTQADLEYEGSVTIDAELLTAADILPFEEVHVWNVTRGTRAHLAGPGDLVIIATFTQVDDSAARVHQPNVVLVDEHNRVRQSHAAEVAGPARR
jgi:aspartate 1-decarboxylase